MLTEYTEADHDKVTELLMGRRVVKVSDNTLWLDSGALLTLEGNDGGCVCGAGDYELTALNEVDNVITKVEFVDDPDDDSRPENGRYEIFVFADNERINLATFEGSDGNGYYGTGYSIKVRVPAQTTFIGPTT